MPSCEREVKPVDRVTGVMSSIYLDTLTAISREVGCDVRTAKAAVERLGIQPSAIRGNGKPLYDKAAAKLIRKELGR